MAKLSGIEYQVKAFVLFVLLPLASSQACLDTQDKNIWAHGGMDAFPSTAVKCGEICWESPTAPCPSGCVQQEHGYSQACGDCMGELISCSIAMCRDRCNDAQSCDACSRQSCHPAFRTCSGLEIPPYQSDAWPTVYPFLRSANLGLVQQDQSKACLNAEDSKRWANGGSDLFGPLAAACGSRCVSNVTCNADCIHLLGNYSPACSFCFGDFISCSFTRCLDRCDDEDSCVDCLKGECGPNFSNCTGFVSGDETDHVARIGFTMMTSQSSMTVLENNRGACTNRHDKKAWHKSSGKIGNFTSQCWKNCSGNLTCNTACIRSAGGFSEGCSTCLSSFVNCTVTTCLDHCKQSEECAQCSHANCIPAFSECSGLKNASSVQLLSTDSMPPSEAGSCDDEHDKQLFEKFGRDGFENLTYGCWKECSNNTTCVDACISSKGYSQSCARCVGDIINCSVRECVPRCHSNETCASCSHEKCHHAYKRCFKSAPTRSLRDVQKGSGACTDESDQKRWREDGRQKFENTSFICGKRCLDNATCNADCMSSEGGYSKACGGCMGDLINCTITQCLVRCSSLRSCNVCTRLRCGPEFVNCSGLKPTSERRLFDVLLPLLPMRAASRIPLLSVNQPKSPPACENHDDRHVWDTHGHNDYDCLKKCGQDEVCLSSCLRQGGYSEQCGNCMAHHISCTAAQCQNDCNNVSACTSCSRRNCNASFFDCHGFDHPAGSETGMKAYQEPSLGACENEGDEVLWLTGGMVEFGQVAFDCGSTCWNDTDCNAVCMSFEGGYSEKCGECMGALISCSINDCLGHCSGWRECVACSREKCNPSFVNCSGFQNPVTQEYQLTWAQTNATSSSSNTSNLGSCENEADEYLWATGGLIKFGPMTYECGYECWNSTTCNTACMEDLGGYSQACSSCMANLITCTVDECLGNCRGWRACLACGQEKCNPSFVNCSGFENPFYLASYDEPKRLAAVPDEGALGENSSQACCQNDADQRRMAALGPIGLRFLGATCGRLCTGNSTCTAECPRIEGGFSNNCSMCIGELIDCTSQCLNRSNLHDFLSCNDEQCVPKFRSCSGLDKFPEIPDTQPKTTEACQNAADRGLWLHGGRAHFGQLTLHCGKMCSANVTCATACMKMTGNYSEPCSICVGTLINCSISKCFSSPSLESMIHCNRQQCDPDFFNCSGWESPIVSAKEKALSDYLIDLIFP